MSSSDPETRAERALGGLREHEKERKAPPLPDRYEIRGELGRGGMAVVHRAYDRKLNREVALKVIRDDLNVDPEDQVRFRREVEATVRLSHPNIVTVFDAGPNYLVMELIKGRTLFEDRPDEKALSVLLEIVARGVHAAHEQGIIHRDLKPSNILVSEEGEPKVADFGIARMSGNLTALTQSGVVIGTPQYMSPEQVEGHREEISPRTDVYALGAILYEGLTGKTPHTGVTPMEVFGKIVNEEPPPMGSKVPRDLETIALRALEKEPSRRFASALEFAHDLARWRDGMPIKARPASALYRLRKRLAKRKAVAVAVICGIAALVVALSILLPKLGQSQRTLELWRDISAILSRSEIAARQGDVEDARERLDRGISKCREFLADDDVADAHYFLGRLLHERGKRAEAIAALDRALELHPGLGEAHFERGLLYVEEYESAIGRVRSAFAGQPPGSGKVTPPAGDELESLHPRLAELRKKAIADLSREVGERGYIRPADALFGKAELERMRWNWDGAVAGFKDVLKKERLYVKAQLALAKLEMFRNRYDAAIDAASKTLEQHKGLGEAYLVRGRARFWKAEGLGMSLEVGELREGSLKDLNQAIFILGQDTEPYRARAVVLWKMGKVDEAIADYDVAVKGDPLDAIARNHRGVALVKKGDLDDAIADFREAARLSPGYAMAHYNLALALLQNDETEEAFQEAEKAVEAAPKNAPYRGQLESLLDFIRRNKD